MDWFGDVHADGVTGFGVLDWSVIDLHGINGLFKVAVFAFDVNFIADLKFIFKLNNSHVDFVEKMSDYADFFFFHRMGVKGYKNDFKKYSRVGR